MTWPIGIQFDYERGPLPEGSTLEARDGYTLLHYRGPGLVDRVPVIGFLLDPTRQILGVALADGDARPCKGEHVGLLAPDGHVSRGGHSWASYEAWLAEMNAS
jgi:hypothetical protein